MKKKELKLKIEELESSLSSLENRCRKLEKDKLTIYNLLYNVNKELDEALSNRQTFIASMSHELRSPLTAILGNSALLKETDLSIRQRKYLEQLNASADFLMALLSDLLDVSKLKESKIELNIQEINFDKLLRDCASMVKSKIADGVNFDINIPTLKYYILSDKKRLQQIFINLLTNAAKFTHKGSILFSLIKINEVENKLEIIVEVKDTGVGIPLKIKEKLFMPFSSMDFEEGTGLGLYISKELATLMGGNIVVETEEGKGSSFRVTFMCEKSSDKISHLENKRFESKGKISKSYQHLNVLIVEDIEMNRVFLKEMFRVFFSIDVDTANNGEVALNKVKKNRYDIIFMDMRMPIMDGLTATREIRKFNQEVPIICMSANVYREDKHEAKIAGMDDFIEKPLDHTDIEVRLMKFFSTKDVKRKEENTLEEMAFQHLEAYFDKESSLKFIYMGKEEIKKSFTTMKKNFSQERCDLMKDDFHSLTGIFANLGLAALAEKCKLFQDYAYENDFEKIEEGIDSFILDVEAFLN